MRSKAADMNESRQGEEIIALQSVKSGKQLGRALLHALHNAGISVLYEDRDMKTVWARNMRAPWVADTADSNGILPPAQAERIGAAKRSVIASGNPERLELGVPAEDGVRWFQVWIDADHGEGGEVQGVVTTMVETTEQKRREQTLKTLLREVSHRSKNLLAIIQSIATQTSRYSGTSGDFLTRFRGRLQSLAASQDLVTSSNWRGAELHEVVSGQVGPYDLLARIGHGGLGDVYRARHRDTGEVVALKLLRGGDRADPAEGRTIQREIEAAGRLAHPGILAILDAGVHDGAPYYVMPLVTGGSLEQLMRTGRLEYAFTPNVGAPASTALPPQAASAAMTARRVVTPLLSPALRPPVA